MLGSTAHSLAAGLFVHPVNCREALGAGPLQGCLGLWEGVSMEGGEYTGLLDMPGAGRQSMHPH